MIVFQNGDEYFCLDPRAEQLWKGKQGKLFKEQVRLTRIPWKLLYYLAKHFEVPIKREELIQQVWGVPAVNDNSVDTAVSKIRKAIGDRKPYKVIETTYPGYRFIAPTEDADDCILGSAQAARRSHKPLRVEAKASVRLLQGYYKDLDLRACNLSRYSFSVSLKGNQVIKVITNIATPVPWRELALSIGDSADGKFALQEGCKNPWYSVPADEVERLHAELHERGIRFENRPIYSLQSFTPDHEQIASFTLGQYADYKIKMGRLEEETLRAALIDWPPDVPSYRRHSKMPLRNKLLRTSRTVAQYAERLCAGGTNILLAFRTPDRDDYVFFIKTRSGSVSSARYVQSLIPSGMHQPSTWFVKHEETSVGATVYRETGEELFGDPEPNPESKDIRPLQFMSKPHLAWFRKNPKAFTLEIVSFGLNLIDGTFEFGVSARDPRFIVLD